MSDSFDGRVFEAAVAYRNRKKKQKNNKNNNKNNKTETSPAPLNIKMFYAKSMANKSSSHMYL